ncbi:MAG: hypothetical protein ABR956_14540 [Terracidiphilus sp.]|jgi:hypothetical protein
MSDSQQFDPNAPKNPGRQVTDAPQSGRALVNSAPASKLPTGVQRALSAVRVTLPFFQRILPLLDGNIGTAVSNILAPHSHTPQNPPPVNFAPIEGSLSDLHAQNLNLRNQIAEQNSSLKRIEDQLALVRETSDRNSQEQEESLEKLAAVEKKVTRFALLAFLLLGASVVLNVLLYLHIKGIWQ